MRDQSLVRPCFLRDETRSSRSTAAGAGGFPPSERRHVRPGVPASTTPRRRCRSAAMAPRLPEVGYLALVISKRHGPWPVQVRCRARRRRSRVPDVNQQFLPATRAPARRRGPRRLVPSAHAERTRFDFPLSRRRCATPSARTFRRRPRARRWFVSSGTPRLTRASNTAASPPSRTTSLEPPPRGADSRPPSVNPSASSPSRRRSSRSTDAASAPCPSPRVDTRTPSAIGAPSAEPRRRTFERRESRRRRRRAFVRGPSGGGARARGDRSRLPPRREHVRRRSTRA